MSSSEDVSFMQLFQHSINSSFGIVELHGFSFFGGLHPHGSVMKASNFDRSEISPSGKSNARSPSSYKASSSLSFSVENSSSDTSLASSSLRTLHSKATSSSCSATFSEKID